MDLGLGFSMVSGNHFKHFRPICICFSLVSDIQP
jgi:hypothetical protein